MDLGEIRTVVFDVGETLVDETRHWTVLAEAAGVPPLTFFAVFGSLIERGEDHRRIWSERWGIEKPSADFFARIVDAMSVEAHAVLYVGDRVDNDIIPAREAGMRTAFLARGPWGTIHKRRPEARLADITVGSLAEFEALLH